MVVGPWVSLQLDSDYRVWTHGEFIEVQSVDYDGLVQEKATGFVRSSNAPRLGYMGRLLFSGWRCHRTQDIISPQGGLHVQFVGLWRSLGLKVSTPVSAVGSVEALVK